MNKGQYQDIYFQCFVLNEPVPWQGILLIYFGWDSHWPMSNSFFAEDNVSKAKPFIPDSISYQKTPWKFICTPSCLAIYLSSNLLLVPNVASTFCQFFTNYILFSYKYFPSTLIFNAVDPLIRIVSPSTKFIYSPGLVLSTFHSALRHSLRCLTGFSYLVA